MKRRGKRETQSLEGQKLGRNYCIPGLDTPSWTETLIFAMLDLLCGQNMESFQEMVSNNEVGGGQLRISLLQEFV